VVLSAKLGIIGSLSTPNTGNARAVSSGVGSGGTVIRYKLSSFFLTLLTILVPVCALPRSETRNQIAIRRNEQSTMRRTAFVFFIFSYLLFIALPRDFLLLTHFSYNQPGCHEKLWKENSNMRGEFRVAKLYWTAFNVQWIIEPRHYSRPQGIMKKKKEKKFIYENSHFGDARDTC
jgi:hypothetical protein